MKILFYTWVGINIPSIIESGEVDTMAAMTKRVMVIIFILFLDIFKMMPNTSISVIKEYKILRRYLFRVPRSSQNR